ncbi:protein of unknown function [Burkholderia multivorans]
MCFRSCTCASTGHISSRFQSMRQVRLMPTIRVNTLIPSKTNMTRMRSIARSRTAVAVGMQSPARRASLSQGNEYSRSGVDHHMPGMRAREARDHACRCLHMVLRMRELPDGPSAKAGGLLRVLFIRQRPVSSGAAGGHLLSALTTFHSPDEAPEPAPPATRPRGESRVTIR